MGKLIVPINLFTQRWIHGEIIQKLKHRITTLCWNKAPWLDSRRHTTIFNLPEAKTCLWHWLVSTASLLCFLGSKERKISCFCPYVYPPPPDDTAPILCIEKRQSKLYFKGHLGLQNCFITDICSWHFSIKLQAGPSVTPWL